MAVVVELALALLAVALVVPVGWCATEILLALRPDEAVAPHLDPLPTTTVLMPAHDEARTIVATLQRLNAELPDNCRVLVVADNCTDETAALARGEGAEVAERHDPQRRGKGFALDFGIRHLRRNPPQVVIILDADCLVHDGAIGKLTALAQRSGQPVQARYLMLPHEDGGFSQRVSAFAFLLNNHHRLLGLQRMGLPVRLNGTGMAFPWSMIERVELGNDNLVEDIKLGIDLAKAGAVARYCPEALVTSTFPQSDEALQTQRIRWEHGHLELVRTVAAGLLLHAVRHLDWRVLGFAVDLLVPPLTLAVYLLAALFGASLVAALAGLSPLPLVLVTLAGAALALGLVLAWWRDGREFLPLAALGAVPAYLGSKLGIYAGYLRRREKSWIRTDRD
jgi:cellulose synthase/poly-beta-1,6-N-acetylglucosamine synthase-like glycosyltransferase